MLNPSVIDDYGNNVNNYSQQNTEGELKQTEAAPPYSTSKPLKMIKSNFELILFLLS